MQRSPKQQGMDLSYLAIQTHVESYFYQLELKINRTLFNTDMNTWPNL